MYVYKHIHIIMCVYKYIHICIHILKDCLVSLYAYYVYVCMYIYIYIIKTYMHWEDKKSPNCLVITTL